MIDKRASTPPGGGAGERAEALRENLRGLRDVDALLAEASRLRREAAAEADQLLAEAQSVSSELLGEAEERASVIVTDARAEAADAKVRLDTALGDIEAGVRELGGHLEGALRLVNALARTLEGVRAGEDPPPPREPVATLPEIVEEPAEQEADEPEPAPVTTIDTVAPSTLEHVQRTDGARDDAGARPLGWLFRATPAS